MVSTLLLLRSRDDLKRFDFSCRATNKDLRSVGRMSERPSLKGFIDYGPELCVDSIWKAGHSTFCIHAGCFRYVMYVFQSDGGSVCSPKEPGVSQD